MQVTQAAHDLAFYGLRAIDVYRPRVDGYNPSLEPLPEELYMRLALRKYALPEDFRGEWKRADMHLSTILRDIRSMKHPERVWRKLLRTFEHATSLPDKNQALGFLNRSEARIKHLLGIKDQPGMTSIAWSSMMYVENLVLKGGFMGSTFLIPVTERPISDRQVQVQVQAGDQWRTVNYASLDPVRRH